MSTKNIVAVNDEVYILMAGPADATSLEFKLSLRKKIALARNKGLTVIIVCDKAEKLESLIDYDPYIFDSEGKININFISFEEYYKKFPEKS